MTAPKAKFTVPAVGELVKQYYAIPGNEAGGSLHVVLDDGNVDTASVQHALEYANKVGDVPGASLARILLEMSKSQRKRLRRYAG
jgi:hypothetical protein